MVDKKIQYIVGSNDGILLVEDASFIVLLMIAVNSKKCKKIGGKMIYSTNSVSRKYGKKMTSTRIESKRISDFHFDIFVAKNKRANHVEHNFQLDFRFNI